MPFPSCAKRLKRTGKTRIIETIARRGYRLSTDVEWIDSGAGAGHSAAPAVGSARRSIGLGVGIGIGLAALVVATALVVYFWPSSEDRPLRFYVRTPENLHFLVWDYPVLSPDGRYIAFAGAEGGRRQLWVQPLDSLTPAALSGTDEAILPFWSPDGRWVGFFTQDKLKKVERSGGIVQTLCALPSSARPWAGGADWSREGLILFAPTAKIGGGSSLHIVPETGGEPQMVTTLDQARIEVGHLWPHFLPDGRHFLYTVKGPPSSKGGVYLGRVGSLESTLLLSDFTMALYAEPGYLLQQCLVAIHCLPRNGPLSCSGPRTDAKSPSILTGETNTEST